MNFQIQCGRGLTTSLETLGSTPSLIAVGTLLFNDHVLKPFWPSALTGKLSDISGLFFAPYFLLAVMFALGLGRLRARPVVIGRWTYVVVAASFAALKLSTVTAVPLTSLAAGIGFPVDISVDPTDLVALGVLPVSLAGWSARLHRDLPIRIIRPRPILALALAAFSIVATSGPPQASLTSIAVDASGVTVYVTLEYTTSADGIYASDPSGSWRKVTATTGSPVADPLRQDTVYVLHSSSWDPTVDRLNERGLEPIGPPSRGPRPKSQNVYGPSLLAVAPWDSGALYLGRNGGLLRSVDRGNTWDDIGAPGEVQDIAVSSERNVLYVLTERSLYRSRDGGERWTFMATVPSSHEMFRSGSVAVHPRDSQMVLVGSQKDLYRTTDGGTVMTIVYTDRGPGTPEGARWVIRFDPSDPDHAYALFGSGCCALMESRNRGVTWADAGLNATDFTVDLLGRVYALGSVRDRVYRRDAGDSTWIDITGSLPVQRAR